MRLLLVKLSIVITSFTVCHMTAFAADGSSGCGPGWYIMKENSLVSSFLRGVTNGLLSPTVTIGMTFGTSNCSRHSLVDADKRSEHLATITFEKLRQDVSQGSGMFLQAYASTFGCDARVFGEFSQTLQSQYAVIFNSPALPENIVERTRSAIKLQPALAAACHAA
jgi:hypothetical protein